MYIYFQQPITVEELKGHTYLQYTTPVPIENTKNPTWQFDYRYPNGFFTQNTYLAIELWNQVSQTEMTYIGGDELTINQLMQFPSQTTLVVFDENGRISGNVQIIWT